MFSDGNTTEIEVKESNRHGEEGDVVNERETRKRQVKKAS